MKPDWQSIERLLQSWEFDLEADGYPAALPGAGTNWPHVGQRVVRTISIIRWRYVGWSAGGACGSFEDESQGCMSWLPRSCRLLVPGVDWFWPEKLLRHCQTLTSILFPRTLQKDCHRATNADRFGVSTFPLALLESSPKILFTGGYQALALTLLGGFGAATGASRSGAAGRKHRSQRQAAQPAATERHAVAPFRAPRQLDLLRGF